MISKKLLVIWYMFLVIAVGIVSVIAITTIFEHQNTAYSVFPDDTSLPAANSQPAKTAADNSITSSFVDVQEPEPDSSTSSIHVTHSSGSTSSSGSSSNSGSDSTAETDDAQEPETDDPEDEEQATPAECLEKYGFDAHTVIFYYSDEPHSNAMKTIVRELETVYGFYWTSALWNEEFNSCFGTTGVTPAFVCSGTGEILLGEVPKSMLESFAERCA